MTRLKGWRPKRDADRVGMTNEERADRIERAVEWYALDKGDTQDESNLGDLLADVLHCYAARGIDPQNAIQTALMHFEAER